MALPLIAPIVAVAHSSGGYIAAKVTADGLVYIGGTLAATKSAALVAGTASVAKTVAATATVAMGSIAAGAITISEWLF